jgi:hypothetical protein
VVAMQREAAPLDPRLGWQLSRLRDAVLARLLLGPASLHRLALDLERLYMEDVVEAPPLLMDIVEEVRLYKRLGLVQEGPSGALYLDESLVPPEARERLEELAARMANALGAWSTPGAEEAGLAVEA